MLVGVVPCRDSDGRCLYRIAVPAFSHLSRAACTPDPVRRTMAVVLLLHAAREQARKQGLVPL